MACPESAHLGEFSRRGQARNSPGLRHQELGESGALSETSALLERVLKEAQEILEKNSQELLARRALVISLSTEKTGSQAEKVNARLNFGMPAWGNVDIDQGRWADAFNLHRRAWEFQLQTWGETHFETGVQDGLSLREDGS